MGHCSHCGYDQRGLPSGWACPECGNRFLPGFAVGDINRWADGALLNLWSIAVLQLVGFVSLLLCYLFSGFTFSGGIMLGMVGTVYVVAGTVWYGAVLVSWVRRVLRPGFKNVTARRQVNLSRWLLCDAVLSVLPICLMAWWIGNP